MNPDASADLPNVRKVGEPNERLVDPDDAAPEREPEPEPDHEPDGLDLARTMNRVVAGSTPAAKQRRKFPSIKSHRVSGSGPDDRDPQLMKGLLERLVGDHGWDVNLRVHGIFGRWTELVGADIAARATPESFDDGVLTVRTDSTAWATQLTLLAPQILTRLNDELGNGTVTTIDVRGPQGPTWKKGRLSSKGRGPRDTYG